MAKMIAQKQVTCAVAMVILVLAAGFSQAEESKGMMQQVEDTAKRVGQKIEDKTKAVVKKIEDKHIGDKVEQKLKKAVTKTGEGIEKAGNKIKEKLGD